MKAEPSYERFRYALCLLQCLLLLPHVTLAKDDDDDEKERRSVTFTGSWDDKRPAVSSGRNGAVSAAQGSVSSLTTKAGLTTKAASSENVDSDDAIVPIKAVNVSAAPVQRLLGLPSGTRMQEKRRTTLKNGAVLVRWHVQYYNVTVYGDVVTAKFEQGGRLSGKYKGNPNCTMPLSSRVPRIAEADAVSRLLAVFKLSAGGTSAYKLTDVRIDRVLRTDSSVGLYRLCYRVSSFVEWLNRSTIPLAPHGLVDALDGSIISSWNGAPSQAASSLSSVIAGVGSNAGLNGSVPPVTYLDIPVSRLANGRCSFNGTIVQVQHMRGGVSGAFVPALFNCTDALNATADRANGGYSPMNDVARNAAVTVRMYQDYFGIDGPTGTLPLKARVHFGVNYENAYYDGTYANFGDGYLTLYPLSTLQVVAHEFSHGFTSATSGLEYLGQSGGISESFSDMAGVAAVHYDTSRVDFTFGASVVKAGIPIRYLCTPRFDGRSIDHISQYKANMDPHYSSGIYNVVFCMLCKAWNVKIVFQLFAVANAYYWSQLTTFTSGACGVLNAAQDMNLTTTPIVSAFKNVGVACPNF